MSLISLPIEILSNILNEVGAEEFRSQLFLLTVCKTWYEIAQPLLLKDLTFDTFALLRFPPESQQLCRLLKTRVRTVSIQVTSFDPNGLPLADAPEYETDEYRLVDWSVEMNQRIEDLGILLSNNTGLTSFSLLILPKPIPKFGSLARLAYRGPWLHPRRITGLLRNLATHQLTSLNLDLRHATTLSSEGRGSDAHICRAIALHLPTIKHLQLCVERICSDALNVMDQGATLPLTSLVVDLRLQQHNDWLEHSKPCVLPGKSYNYLGMKGAVDALVKLAPHITLASILYHHGSMVIPGSKQDVIAFDCLTREKTRIPANGADSWKTRGFLYGYEWDEDDNIMFVESL